MSRKSSTASTNGRSARARQGDNDKDPVIAETRAAYLAVITDMEKDVMSKHDLEKVLQQTGRNPSQKTIDQYWTKDTKKLNFSQLVEIVRELKPTSEDDLLKAFQKIDVNGDGYITQKELARVLTKRGDKMSDQEVDEMIAEADRDGDKKLNYKEFCRMVMSTTSTYKESSLKRLEKEERNIRYICHNTFCRMVMSTTSKCQESSLKRLEKKERKQQRAAKRSKASSASNQKKEEKGVVLTLPPISKQKPSQREPSSIKDWYHAHSKGCFHFDEDEKILAHQYVLEVAVPTKLWLTVKPTSVGTMKGRKLKTDINIFVLKQDVSGLIGDVVAFTNVKNKEEYCTQCELQAGTYRLVPMTTGCQFKLRKRSIKEKKKLVVAKGSDECELTTDFKNALSDIFDMVDLDGNGSLSRTEFNLFQLRTCGEAVDDEAWEVVEENFALEKGELTKKGFMDLNQMEANDGMAEDEQVDDLWVTLSSMGFADDLQLDEACPFAVDVYTEHSPGTLKAQPLQRGGAALNKAICQSVINAAGFTKVKTIQDVRLHSYMGDGRVTLVMENKGSKTCQLKLNCSQSQNCLLSFPDSARSVRCNAGASAIGYHLVPEDEDKEWTINCQEELVTSS